MFKKFRISLIPSNLLVDYSTPQNQTGGFDF